MKMLTEVVQETASSLGINTTRLSPERCVATFQALKSAFGDVTSVRPIWETILSSTSRKRINGWSDIGKFVNGSSCLLLLEERGPQVFRLTNGTDLIRLLSECPGFEFYVTDEKFSYLLCHNHHDFLIGAGTAAPWVSELESDE